MSIVDLLGEDKDEKWKRYDRTNYLVKHYEYEPICMFSAVPKIVHRPDHYDSHYQYELDQNTLQNDFSSHCLFQWFVLIQYFEKNKCVSQIIVRVDNWGGSCEAVSDEVVSILFILSLFYLSRSCRVFLGHENWIQNLR